MHSLANYVTHSLPWMWWSLLREPPAEDAQRGPAHKWIRTVFGDDVGHQRVVYQGLLREPHREVHEAVPQ